MRFHNVIHALFMRFHNVIHALFMRFHNVIQSILMRFHNVIHTLFMRFHNVIQSILMQFHIIIHTRLHFVWIHTVTHILTWLRFIHTHMRILLRRTNALQSLGRTTWFIHTTLLNTRFVLHRKGDIAFILRRRLSRLPFPCIRLPVIQIKRRNVVIHSLFLVHILIQQLRVLNGSRHRVVLFIGEFIVTKSAFAVSVVNRCLRQEGICKKRNVSAGDSINILTRLGWKTQQVLVVRIINRGIVALRTDFGYRVRGRHNDLRLFVKLLEWKWEYRNDICFGSLINNYVKGERYRYFSHPRRSSLKDGLHRQWDPLE